ncbi:MAG: ABC transporter permease subunit [Candidatus Micrarchaeales archaeon]|jgi:ABC-type Na+ efflux pump permease subunit
MQIENSYAIAKKDLREVFSSIGIYGPMLGVPLFFAIALPILTLYVATNSAPSIVSNIISISTPKPSINSVNSLSFMMFFAVNVLGPIFLTMPIFTASVIAADSLVGEKERKTSEALLSMPVSNEELLLGKILASFIPAVLLTIAVFALYGGIVNWLAYDSFGYGILPTLPWILMLISSPFLTIATIGIVVFVSGHVGNIKEAQQISTLLVLPILVMPFVSILGVVDLTIEFMLWLIAFLIVADVLILHFSTKRFRKEAIL